MNESPTVADPVVVLLAHGSPDPAWRRPFVRLCEALQAEHGEGRVRLAYMEFIGPTVDETVRTLIDEGQRHIRVLPLFMAAGGHFKNDITPMVEDLNRQHPDVAIELQDPIGEHPTLIAALQEIAETSLES